VEHQDSFALSLVHPDRGSSKAIALFAREAGTKNTSRESMVDNNVIQTRIDVDVLYEE